MKKNSRTQKFNINGTEYKVRLTNIQYNEQMSDETNCFSATLEVKTPRETYCLACKNDGCGGETDVDRFSQLSLSAIYGTLSDYLKTVPNKNFINYMKDICGITITKDDEFYYMSVESLVDQIVEECLY